MCHFGRELFCAEDNRDPVSSMLVVTPSSGKPLRLSYTTCPEPSTPVWGLGWIVNDD